MAKNTISINNNGVAWSSNIERHQLKKHISGDNPTGDVIKVKFANMNFVIPSNIWFKSNMATRSFFDLYQMGELGQWHVQPPKNKWERMMEGR